MQGNGARVALVNPTGSPVNSSEWEAPKGSSPYFGFLDSKGGFNTIKIESIIALHPNPNGMFVVHLGTANMVMDASDGFRLMKRLGWSEMSRLRTE